MQGYSAGRFARYRKARKLEKGAGLEKPEGQIRLGHDDQNLGAHELGKETSRSSTRHAA